jgi:chaperonin GroES
MTLTNNSGVAAIGFRVLVCPDEVEEKTKGGLMLPDEYRSKEAYAQARGVVVSVGANAFDEISDAPSAGTRVIFPKFEGTEVIGADGKIYRLIEDRFIIGVEVQQ